MPGPSTSPESDQTQIEQAESDLLKQILGPAAYVEPIAPETKVPGADIFDEVTVVGGLDLDTLQGPSTPAT